MDDPFGDPFAEASQPLSQKPSAAAAAAVAAKPAPVAQPAVAPSKEIDDLFATPASSAASSGANGAPAVAAPAADAAKDSEASAAPAPAAATPPPSIGASEAEPAADAPSSTSSTTSSSASAAAVAPAAASIAAVTASLSDLAASYVDLDDEEAADELSLEGQGLTAFPQDLIRTRGNELRRIDLTSNHLTDLKSLEWPYGGAAWPALRELILDKNQLSDLTGLPPIPSLTTLWLNTNRVADLDAVLDAVEKLAPKLTYLSMLRNPAVPDMYFSDGEMEAYQRYRLYVIYRLRSLESLDASPVTPEERKEAALRGQYCRVAKPLAPKVKSPSSSASGGAASPASSSSSPSVRQSQVGVDKNATRPPKVATFLAKGKPRYDGTNSEGNRFIMNDDL